MAYVLIVDDDEDFASAAARVLGAAGFEVRIELDTRSAMKRVEERPPDLAILDVMFPEDATAGFRMARAMRRRHGKLSSIPVLMLTAVNSRSPTGSDVRSDTESRLPVEAFLEKPVDLDVLRSVVSALLKTCSSRHATGAGDA